MITEIKQVNGETFAKVRLTTATVREIGCNICCTLCAASAWAQKSEKASAVHCFDMPSCKDDEFWVQVEEGVL